MKEFKKVKTAIIGCGMISPTYLNNCVKRLNILDVVGCCDIRPERSEKRATEYGIRQMTNEEIYNDPTIELVINITYHTSHYKVSKEALEAGKNVYSEKMMAVTFEEGKELVELARKKGLLYGVAPDTFMGAGLQTARRAIDAGYIGEPIGAEATLVRSYHHERYRDDPERRFAFLPGGGIIFDVGCYYLTGLVNLLGPASRVAGFSTTRCADERVYGNPANPDYGKVMKIETPNHTSGIIEFANGVFCPFMTTSEGAAFTNRFSIFGTEGTLTLNDPNTFLQPITVRAKTGDATPLPVAHAFVDNYRGLGAADLAYSLRNGREPRADCSRGLHTLEIATGMIKSGETGMIYNMTTSCTRAEPLAVGYTEAYPEMVLDL